MTGWHSIQTPPSHPGNVGGEVIPDEFGTEPLLGYRGWHVVDAGDGRGHALKSLHVSFIWDRQIQAFCHYQAAMFLNGTHTGSVSPDPDCSCGIYAQLPEHPIGEWDTVKQGKVSASGTIAMWGRIIQCERGYKAQYAEIQSPLVLDVSCVKGCERSPTKIALARHAQLTFTSFCDEHIGLVEGQTTVEAGVWLEGVSKALSRRYRLEVLTWG